MLFPRQSHLQKPSLQDFIHQKTLGSGTFGLVSKYVHKKTKLPYAIKKMSLKDKSKKDLLMIQKEIQVLYKISNKYVVGLIDHFQNSQNNEIYLIMEFVDGQDLHKSVFTKKVQLQFSEIATIIYQIAVGLAQLHENHIIHRDLKLQNVIYLPNKSIKLVDLGCSNYYGEDIQRLTSIGTKFYFSPELLSGEGQDDKLDVWCLGVLMYQLLFFTSPFKGNEMFIKIRKIQYQVPEQIRNDYDLNDLFQKILCYKHKRLRARQVVQHPWIQKHCRKQILIIDIEKQVIDKQQMRRYKNILLQQIENCENDIQKLKDCNLRLKNKIQSQGQEFSTV